MAADENNLALLRELETIDVREDHILDLLLERGLTIEQQLAEVERRNHILTVEHLGSLEQGLTGLQKLIGELQERLARADAAAVPAATPAPAGVTAGGAAPQPPVETVEQLAALIRERSAESDRLRAVLEERLRALHALHPMPENPPTPKLDPGLQPRTLRMRREPMSGPDVESFQRVLNTRYKRWGIDKRVPVDGVYGLETCRAAREIAHGLGVAAERYRLGMSPELRALIRKPSRRTTQELKRAHQRKQWRRKLARLHAKARPHRSEGGHPASGPESPRPSSLAAAVRKHGGRYEDIIIAEAGRYKVPVSLVCAVMEKESTFRNIYGRDSGPKHTNPIKSPKGGVLQVTEANYREYLRHRKLGHGNQGVGPMQLTWPSFQDDADRLGGCWKPEHNIRRGVKLLADNIKRAGSVRQGVRAYNGPAGSSAEDYAVAVLKLELVWRKRLGGATARPPDPPAGASKPRPQAGATHELRVLERGDRSESARALQAAARRRLSNRHLHDVAKTIDENGVVDAQTIDGVITAAWALGAQTATVRQMRASRKIPVGVQRMVRNPGRRTEAQQRLGKKRIAHVLVQRKKRAAAAAKAGTARMRVVKLAQQAAENYRRNPGAYHYLAGGKANLVFLKPTPKGWRSDCSQFVAAVYKAAGLPSPANVDHQWASTFSMVKRGRVTQRPRPGDLGMYGSRGAPTHVELYCGLPGQEFIGHGSAPIDSQTPGRPSYYLTYDFLD